MTKPYTGCCACGAARFEVVGQPVDMNHCQCRQCQRASGTGHGSHLTFVGASVSRTGDTGHWVATGDLGTRKSRHFCPTCGMPVYMTFPDMPDVFVVYASSLDDPEQFAPQFTMWTAAGRTWDPVDATIPSFEKLRPS
ncbi:GFA family protein [Arenibaculum sp.]|uniref:GFA family protein n=1 Tax=Arenibaculum sp. TaxID=2865862 RepID=UPI002E0FEDE1|nr:GFA family protein [Arenibaculum sp.]